MSRVPQLLAEYRSLCRQQLETERALDDVERQLVALGETTVAPGERRGAKSRRPAPASEILRETVRALRAAPGPVGRNDLAGRLGLSTKTVSRRLAKAIAAGFVERVSIGRYRVVDSVPQL